MRNYVNFKQATLSSAREQGIRVATFFIAALLTATSAMADIPANYYRSASAKQGEALKTALHNLIYRHTEVSSYQNLPQYFRITDVYPPEDARYGQWWEMYGNIPLYLPSFAGMNREHSFPKSWWGGSQNTPAYVDLFHLYPSEQAANMAKSNYPLGETQGTGMQFDNGVSRVGYPMRGQGGGAPYVFEPDDEYKGDFARTYFYVVTCYQNLTWKKLYMVNNNLYPTLNDWSVQLLLKWHRNDPVSQKELLRNEEIYKIQANRNPFIDYPELAEYLWGNKKGQVWVPGNSDSTGDPDLITPVQDMSLDFGETAVGRSNTASLFFQGENLRGNLTITITKPRGYAQDDRSLFVPDATQVNTTAVNSESGFWLRITYTPKVVGTNRARLVISDGGLTGSRGIELRGEGLPVPTLHSFSALAASDITDTSYMANWEEPEGDVVDYYVVSRTTYTNGKAETIELPAETNQLLIDDCTPGSSETYMVRSCRLGYFSPWSNIVSVDLAGLSTPGADKGNAPLGWAPAEGGIRIVCGEPHTGVKVFDTQGRLVATYPVIENNTIINLPEGFFIISSDQQHKPVRAIVKW